MSVSTHIAGCSTRRAGPWTRRAASIALAIAQSTRLLLSGDLVAYCGSLVA